MNKAPLICMEDIVKIFPPSKVALDNVSIKINEGEVHAIIGENGAGKSTLMKVLYALEKPNSGTISINGKKVDFNSPKDAVAMGIGMVHQEFMLIPGYSIIENIMLGYESVDKFGFIDRNKAKERFRKVAEAIKFDIDPDEKVENLSVAVQQKVEIIKQLYREVNILILDEPTLCFRHPWFSSLLHSEIIQTSSSIKLRLSQGSEV